MIRFYEMKLTRSLMTTSTATVLSILAMLALVTLDSPTLAQEQKGSGSGQSAQDDGDQPRGDRPDRGDRGQRGDRGNREGRGDRGTRGDRGDRMGRGGPGFGGPEGGRGGSDRGPGGPDRGLGLMGTPEGLFSPDYMTRDVPLVVEDLQLDDTQRAIVAQLFEDYDTNFREMVDALKSETDSLNEAFVPDPDLEESMDEIRESMRSMRDEARAARREFGPSNRGENGRPGRDRDQQRDAEGDAGAGESKGENQVEQETQEERRARGDALRDEFRMRFEDLRGQMQSVREKRYASTEMQAILDARVALIREFARDKRQLRDSTASGILALLVNENQAELWEDVSRKLRRKRLMSRGRLSGESTDVLQILGEMELEEASHSEDLAMLKSNYAIELDRALQSRDNFNYAEGLDLMEHLRDRDFDGGLSVLRKRLVLQEATRDVNDQYIEAISLVLVSPQSDEFRLQSLRRGYSNIYRPTRGERAMVAAMEIEELDPDVLVAVADLMQSHGDEIASFNEDMLLILRSEESARELRRAEERMSRFRGERSERDEGSFDPVREAMEKRNEIDQRYMSSLESILGPELYETIAGRRRGRGGGGDRGQEGFSREQFIGEFDKNGDGQLDEDERRAARDAMRERFRGGQGGRGGAPGPREL